MAVRVLCLFLRVPWVCLQCVIMVFPGHTHVLVILSIDQLLCYLLSDNSRMAVNSMKDLGQFPIQSAQILTACG